MVLGFIEIRSIVPEMRKRMFMAVDFIRWRVVFSDELGCFMVLLSLFSVRLFFVRDSGFIK